MTEAQDPYAYWRAALQAKSKRDLPPTSDGDVHCGRYRMRQYKDGPWVPVAVWPVEGQNHACMIDGNHVEHQMAQAKASFFHQNPVTQEQFTEFMEAGRWWDEVGAAIGHNNPPDDGDQDEHVSLSATYAALLDEAAPMLEAEVTTQDQADKYQAMAEAFREVALAAEKAHKEEKAPHLKAGQAVDKKWKSLKSEPRDEADKVKRKLTAFLRKQQEKRLAEARRLEEEAMAQAKRSDNAAEVQEKMVEAQQLKQAPTKVGTTGRKVQLKTTVEAVIMDWDKVLADPQIRQHPHFIERVQELCNRAVTAGKTIEGVERKEEKVAA